MAGPSCRVFLSPGLLTRYALCRPRLMARGQVRCRRPGLRFLFLVMSAMTRARAARACSGGKSRADGPADDAQGALEPDPARVDPGAGGGGADQGAERAPLLPRFQPQLVSQHVPGPPVGRQRISLPLCPVPAFCVVGRCGRVLAVASCLGACSGLFQGRAGCSGVPGLR